MQGFLLDWLSSLSWYNWHGKLAIHRLSWDLGFEVRDHVLDPKAFSNDFLDCKRRSKKFTLVSELGSNTSCFNELLNRKSPSKEFSPSLNRLCGSFSYFKFFSLEFLIYTRVFDMMCTQIARDESGVPDVLYKISGVTPIVEPIVTVVPEYVS